MVHHGTISEQSVHRRSHQRSETTDVSKLHQIVVYADWRLAGSAFRKYEDFGIEIERANEFLPSVEYIEKWTKNVLCPLHTAQMNDIDP